eukprot:TRINITY_DN5145_c0_g1_i1.p1 TRINITY_DN5145_c0_g1~~TRINITY_DN5145_c0_g1_i1.p1  ORF type:complete len:294 (+),score=38.46 TRINITY_DN5145_c0_g1_i1:199-1080(+)
MFKNEVVACKQIKNQDVTEKEKAAIQREIDVMKRLSHQNIIAFLQVIEDFDFTYIFMEYVSGGNLRDYILKNQNGLTEPEAKRLFQDIHAGLYYLHCQSFVHRDLKTRNILLTERGEAKIADFGLSREWKEGELIDEWCGTLHYRAPEIVKREPYTGPEIDLWSLGVILFELVSGKRPFTPPALLFERGFGDEEDQKIEAQIVKGEFSMPTFLSPNLEDLIRGLLTMDPKNRFTSQQVFASPWLIDTHTPKTTHHPEDHSDVHFTDTKDKSRTLHFMSSVFHRISHPRLTTKT